MSNDLNFDPNRPLFVPSGERFPIAQSQGALAMAFASGRPVLIYLHGRAKGIGEPRKSVQTNIYRGLGSYGVSVIGFTWDADDGGYDETRPLESADNFDRFLDALAEFQDSAAGRDEAKPSLIAHSMGNLIVAELAKEGRLDSGRGMLFRNIVMNAAAVKAKRHHMWLEKIGTAQRNYVMINQQDKVLLFAGFLFRPNMLGRELRGPGAASDRTTYVELSQLGVNHRYFVPAAQNNQASLRSFFAQALVCHDVNFDGIAEPEGVDGIKVRRLKPGGILHEVAADADLGSVQDEDQD